MEFAKLWILYRKHGFSKSSEVFRVPKGVTMIFRPQRPKERRASVTKSPRVEPYASLLNLNPQLLCGGMSLLGKTLCT